MLLGNLRRREDYSMAEVPFDPDMDIVVCRNCGERWDAWHERITRHWWGIFIHWWKKGC